MNVAKKIDHSSEQEEKAKGEMYLVKEVQKNKRISLLETIGEMGKSLKVMQDIISKADFIAINASIEAARTQTQAENFSLVAEQVRRQAERTQELSSILESEINALESFALRATAVRYSDMANDIIDKIDRNLFERNCDCQAWAGFLENVQCARILKDHNVDSIRKIFKDKQSEKEKFDVIMASCARLQGLMETYKVYVDIFVLNNRGVVVAAAKNKRLIGHSYQNAEYVQQVLEKNQVYVNDMSYAQEIKAHTVTYSAPIIDETGKAIGILSTRFNWDYVQDMVDKLPVEKSSKIYIISSMGTLLSSSNRFGILQDNLSWLNSGEAALNGKSGYAIECSRNGQIMAWGFCHTFGYNAYKGKGWSAIVTHPVELEKRSFFLEEISRDGKERLQAADNANADLERVANSIRNRVTNINTINNETNMLAVNAAIQAGVAGAEGESFSVIASEIGKLARKSEEFVNSINELTKTLGDCVRNTVYKRLGEAAFDTIDKIDRNLFERNCDVQAFASFAEIIRFLIHRGENGDILELLKRLHEIYEVYHDIFLLDKDGNITATAINTNLIGQNQRDRDWFRDCLAGNLVVTDLYFSKSINQYTVTFAAPVRDEKGNVIGVMTTRFNCNFVYDIMKATIVGQESNVYLINSRGIVIGSPEGEGLLKDSFAHLKAFRSLENKANGFVLDEHPYDSNRKIAVGFAKTSGYINYRGKGWSVFILRDVHEHDEVS